MTSSCRPTQRKGILVICAVNGHGGPAASMRTVIEGAHVSWDFFVATQWDSTATSEQWKRIPVKQVQMDRPQGWNIAKAMVQVIRASLQNKRDIHVIHANGLTEAVVALPAHLLLRKPVVVWIHNWATPRPFARLRMLIKVLGKPWRWFAVSDVAQDLVREIPSGIIRNPIGPGFQCRPKPQGEVLRIGYLAGTDRLSKGFDLLPSIISQTPADQIRWIIYTSPPYSSKDAACRVAWDWFMSQTPHNVDVRKRTSDVPEALYDLDAVLVASRNESYNRLIAEAVATGTPFIASDIAAHREHLRRSGAGYLFKSGDADDAAFKIRQLASDRSRIAALTDAAVAASPTYLGSDTVDLLSRAWTFPDHRSTEDGCAPRRGGVSRLILGVSRRC